MDAHNTLFGPSGFPESFPPADGSGLRRLLAHLECLCPVDLVYFQEKPAVPVAVQLVRAARDCKKMASGPGVLCVLSADRWLGLLV